MQRNPEELYELGPATPDIADAPFLHYLDGFIDAGGACRLLTEHLLSSFDHETVAVSTSTGSSTTGRGAR